MTRLLAVAACALALATTSAHARPHHHHRHHIERPQIGTVVCNRFGCRGEVKATIHIESRSAAREEGVVGGRPAGCPHAFCGCEASIYLFGRIVPDLNLAANWIRKFPRSSPAPGMAAARQHHVMVLISHVSGSDWLVHDGNSGHHLTRNHIRSIAGYIIVNPHSRYAMQ